ncbi:MAG: FtsX-like permease family protein [Luteitalea sp.]|nr:FtsX-like permease family protein [Luteitalea sp.]
MRMRRLGWDVLQDLRYAVRLLSKAPGFTMVAVLSLALGIGANIAVFSFVDGILLRPLDVPRPQDVVRITTATPAQRFSDLSYLEFETIRDGNTTLSGLAAEWQIEMGARADGKGGERGVSRVTLGSLVNRDYFTTLGMAPALGRNFLAEEDSPGARDIAAIVSHRAWQTRFDGDPQIIGRRITVNGLPVVVVGVAPAQFTGTDLYMRHEVYLPLAMAPRIRVGARLLENPAERGLIVRGRLKPHVTVAAAAADIQALARALEETHPETSRQRTATVLRDIDQRLQTKVQDSRLSMMLLGTVLLVLVIAAVNVANLLLGRAAARGKEIAIRMSVGASRLRLVRQLLTESLLLALLGGGVGLLLAQWAVWSLRSIPLPTDLPIVIDLRLDQRVFLYGLVLALITGIVFGVAPALHATRRDLTSPVKGGATGRRPFRGRYALVAAQAALSVVLLICAGLFVKSFHRAAVGNPGYRVDGVLLTSFSPSLVNMPTARIETFYQQIQDRVRALPGVASVTLAKHVNLGPDGYSRRIAVASCSAWLSPSASPMCSAI